MTWTVITGIHHDEFIGEPVCLTKFIAAFWIESDRIVMRPGRDHQQFLRWDPFCLNTQSREPIQDENPFSAPHAVVE